MVDIILAEHIGKISAITVYMISPVTSFIKRVKQKNYCEINEVHNTEN